VPSCFDRLHPLLRGIDRQSSLTERIDAALTDTRHASGIAHTQRDLLTQRIYQIGCGDEDAYHSNGLRHDPTFKLGTGRLPCRCGKASSASPCICPVLAMRPPAPCKGVFSFQEIA